MIVVASWLLLLVVCQSCEVKLGSNGMAARTAVPRPSAPWQAMQRVLKVAPAARIFSACAAVSTVDAEGSGGGSVAPVPAAVEGSAATGAGAPAMGGVETGAGCGCGRGPASRSPLEVGGGLGGGAGAGGTPGAGPPATGPGTPGAGIPPGVADTTCLPPLKARMKATMSFTSVLARARFSFCDTMIVDLTPLTIDSLPSRIECCNSESVREACHLASVRSGIEGVARRKILPLPSAS